MERIFADYGDLQLKHQLDEFLAFLHHCKRTCNEMLVFLRKELMFDNQIIIISFE